MDKEEIAAHNSTLASFFLKIKYGRQGANCNGALKPPNENNEIHLFNFVSDLAITNCMD